jgi:uncharacterized membrane protein YphA (DoxX/SURF4 family)
MRALAQVRRWLLDDVGSTRPLGLFRIAIVLLIWTRLALDFSHWNSRCLTDAAVGVLLLVVGAMGLIGYRTRFAMAALTLILAVIYFVFGWSEQRLPYQHHHIYLLLICTFLTALGPCERSFTVDAMLARRSGTGWHEEGSLTANRLVLVQLSAIYFWAAVDKTQWTFLSGLRLEQILYLHYYETSFRYLLYRPLITAASVGVVVVEYLLPVLILTGKCRHMAVVLALALHGSFYFWLPVQTFSATMLAMYIFLIPSRVVDEFIGLPTSVKERSL